MGAMDYGLALPNFTDGASREAMEAGAESAERLGWSTVWTTDHLIVPSADAGDYGQIYEAILSLAWIGARYSQVRLGTSVIVIPQRNAVLVAKELASLDALTGGRVIAGIGGGWNEREYSNLGVADRFHVRGAYIEETVALWRHLWSGSTEPFHGRFHQFDDFTFGPLPVQGDRLRILIGGRARPAIERAGRIADGYHSSATSPTQYAERVPILQEAAESAGRPTPWLTARVRVAFGDATDKFYAIRGTPEQMADEVKAYAKLGVEHLALWFGTTDPEELAIRAERFAHDVAPLV
jgi:probable F420-dependent oxidoreductase